jgi:hypothetical protein
VNRVDFDDISKLNVQMANFQLPQLIDSLHKANDVFEDLLFPLSPKVIDNLDIFQFLPPSL